MMRIHDQRPASPARRSLLKAGGGMALMGACTPLALAASEAPLTAGASALWEVWLDTLVPGAAQAGAVAYLDSQLRLPRDQRVLFLRYTDWSGSHAAFYLDGLAAVDRLSRALHGQGLLELSTQGRLALAGQIAAGAPPDWQGPPAGLFHFVCKADGADLVFGTERGIERLGLAYRAHIAPTLPWPVMG